MKHLRQAILVVLILGAIIGVIGAAMVLQSVAGLPQDAYASDWTAIFVIEHLQATQGRWPQGWSDLEDEFNRLAQDSHYAWSFAELQESVALRFDLTSDQIREAAPPIEVIRLTSGRRVNYQGDPNAAVREYLRASQGGRSGTSP